MKPRVKHREGRWHISGGLAPIELCLAEYQSLGEALDALCRWYKSGGGAVMVPYGGETAR